MWKEVHNKIKPTAHYSATIEMNILMQEKLKTCYRTQSYNLELQKLFAG